MEVKDVSYYRRIGFLCGLEIHQRLATAEKLFCSCTATLQQGELPAAEVRRRQRAVAGELGAVDRAASFEQEKEQQFIYRVSDGHACLVDIDEEPPHSLNAEAMAAALGISCGMHADIPDELEPMRKLVVDGSNPSAFQRTTKVGMDGYLNVNGTRVAITSVFLEEESAGIERRAEDGVVYDTGRIGIPLVEIDTDPHLGSPEKAKETALAIGTLLRLTGKAQRGIGTIRQDVNVSIMGGARVEIKGLQDLDSLDKFVENEVLRQQNLVKIKEELSGRKNASVGGAVDITHLFTSTGVKIISNAISSGGIVLGIALGGFGGILGREINPERRLGTEISDYAKMGGVNGIIHSDEDPRKYGFRPGEMEAAAKALGAGEGDAFILIAGRRDSAYTAASFASERAKAAIGLGVVPETRAAVNNNMHTTKFMRPLAGRSRMYPETDATPIEVSGSMLAEARASAPDLDAAMAGLMSELKSRALADQMIMSPRLQLYRELAGEAGSDKAFIANTLLQKFTEMRRAGCNVDAIPAGRLSGLFKAHSEGRITKNAVEEILKSLSERDADIEDIIKARGLSRVTGSGLRKIVLEELEAAGGGGNRGAIINRIMSKHRLNVDGDELNRILSEEGRHGKEA
ncbi:MAG: Glu-tRNA(Gln) amidotransferase subunit GatE [Candidatus Marsarchaeota archaeon]|nr:Glu-tRNA(Gln) amidotransferase subunit GatE [Candidatus Marsarchaeota archaeon]